MAFSKVASLIDGLGTNGGTTATSIDTTGANLITAAVARDSASSGSVTDSKGNTYTARGESAYFAPEIQIYDCLNPTVGSSHTFTFSVSSSYSSIGAIAWSGAHASSSFDQENGGAGSGTSQASGNVTPSEDNELIFTALAASNVSTNTLSSPFTVDQYIDYLSDGLNQGLGLGYEIQTTATTRSPSWSGGGTMWRAVRAATYKAAAAATGNRRRRLLIAGTR